VLSWPAWRRAIALVCALAFLVVGVAHGVQHSHVDHGAIVSLDGSDAAPEPTVDPIEHCHACVMVATAATFAVLPAPDARDAAPSAPRAALHDRRPVAETPPPIALI
jgi:hypothetical protein